MEPVILRSRSGPWRLERTCSTLAAAVAVSQGSLQDCLYLQSRSVCRSEHASAPILMELQYDFVRITSSAASNALATCKRAKKMSASEVQPASCLTRGTREL